MYLWSSFSNSVAICHCLYSLSSETKHPLIFPSIPISSLSLPGVIQLWWTSDVFFNIFGISWSDLYANMLLVYFCLLPKLELCLTVTLSDILLRYRLWHIFSHRLWHICSKHSDILSDIKSTNLPYWFTYLWYLWTFFRTKLLTFHLTWFWPLFWHFFNLFYMKELTHSLYHMASC